MPSDNFMGVKRGFLYCFLQNIRQLKGTESDWGWDSKISPDLTGKQKQIVFEPICTYGGFRDGFFKHGVCDKGIRKQCISSATVQKKTIKLRKLDDIITLHIKKSQDWHKLLLFRRNGYSFFEPNGQYLHSEEPNKASLQHNLHSQ